MTKKMKILVVRYRFIGDTILAVPFLRNLRRHYPDAQIDMLVAPMSGEIIENCPYVDNFIYFDTTKKHRYENTTEPKKTFFSYVKLLKETGYDKAYILKRSLSSAILVFLAGIKKRIGFNTEGRGLLLTKRVAYKDDEHEIKSFLSVLESDNIVVQDDYLENWIDEKDNKKIENILKGKNIDGVKKVIVHATSGNIKKQWGAENFAKVVEYLSNVKKVQVIYIGAKSDIAAYEKIGSLISNELEIKPLNFCSEFTLKESLAMISKADLIVGCDSGNLHMAASVKTPVIGVYGPMNAKKWAAWGEGNIIIQEATDCGPCGLKTKCKKDYACLKNITAESVINEIDKLLSKEKICK